MANDQNICQPTEKRLCRELLPSFRQEYLRTNRFVLYSIEHKDPVLNREQPDTEWYKRNIAEITLPTVSFGTVEQWDGMAYNRGLSKINFGDITMSFYAEENYDPILNWVKAHAQHVGGSRWTRAIVKAPSSYKKDFQVYHVDGGANILGKWEFLGCQLVGFSMGNLSYRSDGEVAMFSMTIQADRIIFPDKASVGAATISPDWMAPPKPPANADIVETTSLDAPPVGSNPAGFRNNSRNELPQY